MSDSSVAPIYLIGFSGTGKSHIARLVAEKLGWQLLDMDEAITRKAGVPIIEIFEWGEEHFRKIEREVLREMSRDSRKVISTGGGVPVDARNREAMRASGFVVWLTARPDTIYGRLSRSFRGRQDVDNRGVIRPMLQSSEAEAPLERIQSLLDSRKHAYADCANVSIETDDLSPEQVAEGVIAAWEAHKRERA